MSAIPSRHPAAAALAIATTAFIVIGCGGTGGPAATQGGPGATAGGPAATPGGPVPGTTEGTATLVLDGTDVKGSWELSGAKAVLPTDTLLAAIFTETVDDVAAGHGDLITITLTGTTEAGTRPTSGEGITVGFGVSRIDTAGNDIFVHQFTSADGSCQVTMAATATGWSGSFTCASVTDLDGHTVSANGTFNT